MHLWGILMPAFSYTKIHWKHLTVLSDHLPSPDILGLLKFLLKVGSSFLTLLEVVECVDEGMVA